MKYLSKLLTIAGIFGATLGIFFSLNVQAEESMKTIEKMLDQSLAHMKAFFSHEQSEGVRNLLGITRVLYVAPHVTGGGLLVGLEKG